MTHPVHDGAGQFVADVALSDQDIERLTGGETITVRWHTPRMMQGELGTQSGSFDVVKRDENFVTSNPGSAKAYAELQARIARLKAERDAGGA